ncbi:MAG TPA: histidine kinase dimerization/phospho-acceptor domain-containing protein, partial [Albitalea sp.]
MRLPSSLQGRLLGLVLGVVVAVWVSTAVMTWLDVRHELDELLDAHLTQAAALLVVQQREVDDDEIVDAPTLHRYAPKVAFQVFHEGQLVLRSANAPSTPMVDDGEHFTSGFRTVRLDDTTWRVFATHGAERDVQVYVGEQAASRASILGAVLQSTLWPMIVALPILALAAWLAVHRSVRPLRRLGALLAARRPQTLQPVVLDDAPSEVRPVVEALNVLFGRIGTLLDSERRFTADAAHELRTPIAAIRAQAQVALGEADDGRRRHALQGTLEGCDRATRLVDQLLTLARLEAQEAVATSRVDLSAVARQVASELAPKAFAKRQDLEVQAPQPCPMQGDEVLLTVLLRNLVDNAIRYGPASARGRIKVDCHDGGIVLGVEDSGPGMSPTDLGRLGERFFRVAGSAESGSGLG